MTIEIARSTPAQGRTRGVALMVLSVLLLTLMDAGVKELTRRYPVPVIMVFRCFLAVPVLLLALPRDGGLTSLLRVRPGLQLLRGAFGFLTALCYFQALADLPLADALAVSFSAPMFVALLSRPLLGEAVSRRSWTVIIGGFIGVLVVVRPGMGGLGPGAAYASAAALFYALHGLTLRRLGHSDGATATTILGSLVIGLIALPVAAFVWVTPSSADLPIVVGVAFLGATGGLAMSAAYRHAPAAVLAPLDYTAMVWAVLLGAVLFGDIPGPPVVIGSIIIILSGLWLIRGRRG
jgi:drug/metabolite transporter (DMT)-like permease